MNNGEHEDLHHCCIGGTVGHNSVKWFTRFLQQRKVDKTQLVERDFYDRNKKFICQGVENMALDNPFIEYVEQNSIMEAKLPINNAMEVPFNLIICYKN